MIPELSFKSFSNDQYCLDKVFYSNFYHLKKLDELKPTIIDIGAHCGFFTFLCAVIGAKSIYSFEPFSENYKFLIKNIASFKDLTKISTYHIGIHDSLKVLNLRHPKAKNSHFDFLNIESDLEKKINFDYDVIPAISLDFILKNIVTEEKVDILKINIGYDEIPILLDSLLISEKVNSICLQTFHKQEDIDNLKILMNKKGFIENHIIQSEEEEGLFLMFFSKVPLNTYFAF